MIQNFDFHIHTSNSDGDYNIDEIIKKITENNIEYFAITDHDNIDSIEQLKDKKLNYITGIEFSGRFKKYNMHILGYYLDGDLSKVKLLCDKIKELRDEGWTLKDIAKHIGCAASTVSRILNGKLYVETKDTLDLIIDNLNTLREMYLETGNTEYWRQIIELLPQSYNQTRTVTMTYENIYAMRQQRKGHKLDEWRIDFFNWSDELPHLKELFD